MNLVYKCASSKNWEVYMKAMILLTALLSFSAQAKIVKHFVAFKFDHSVTSEDKKLVMKKFLSLKQKCLKNNKPYILSVEAGLANSPEGADQGFEQGYVVTFASEADRNYYVGKPFFTNFDPAHDEFKNFVGPLLMKQEGAFVFDFSI
jgi:hypothetical protein